MVRVSHHLLQSWILIQKSVVHCLMCWTNHRKKALQCSGQEFWKNHVCEQLRGLEVKCITFPQAMQVAKKWCFSLINSINHNAAAAILEQQQLYFMEMLKNTASRNAALGGCKHLDYLTASWMLLPMWRSWSGWGHLVAAAAMNILVQGVIPTTNHLESFNTILKQKHLAAWLHSGHWLRFDLLIHILITCILPGIYSCQRTQQEYSDWLCSHFLDKTGGQNLSKLHKQGMEEMWQENLSSLSWWQLDAKCDQEAAAIVQLKMLMISWGEDNASFKVTCTSSILPISLVILALYTSLRDICLWVLILLQPGGCMQTPPSTSHSHWLLGPEWHGNNIYLPHVSCWCTTDSGLYFLSTTASNHGLYRLFHSA